MVTYGQDLLLKNVDELHYDPTETKIEDASHLKEFEKEVRQWWVQKFSPYVPENNGFFTPPQREAIPRIKKEKNTLVASPTGSGKTLASFATVIDELVHLSKKDELENSVYALYISPLKSLANDIHRNLEVPLNEIQHNLEDAQEIRQAIRHGDTSSSDRQKMLDVTPHILNTTPETLAILLNSPKFKEKLRSVQYIIVDEIHSLADNKRGVHLSVSLERLEELANSSPTRIGCSATVEPLEEVANFLSGLNNDGSVRERDIVDTRFVREYDLKVESPVSEIVTTPKSSISEKFYARLHRLIQDSTSTLVFTNTRSGAERVLHNLREKYTSYNETNSGAHHGSLSKEKRQEVEQKMKNGEIKVVTTSTSLELGIDMPHLDLVVQIGSPKSISGLLQRIGRAGHQLGETVKGRILVLDRDELVETAVMTKKAKEGYIDRVFIPTNAQDVAVQQVYGMAINKVRPKEKVKQILSRAYPYRTYSEKQFENLLRYLTSDYDGLEDRNVYPKIWVDTNDPPDGEYHYPEYETGTTLIGKRGRYAQAIYMTNIGTIPDSFSCEVFTRKPQHWVGSLDEEYLDTLEKGDVFVLGGDNYRYQYRKGSKVYVDQTNEKPTVPSWFSERLPLSYDLSKEILSFQKQMLVELEEGDPQKWLESYPINNKAIEALIDLYTRQKRYAGATSISTPERVAVEEQVDREEQKREYYVRTLYGRHFNDGLSRIVAQKLSEESNTNVKIAVSDHGFTLSLPLSQKHKSVSTILENITAGEVRPLLRRSLQKTELLKRYFRINATRALMILKYYKGNEKSAKQQQVSSDMLLNFTENLDDFIVIEETYRELMEDKLSIDKIYSFAEEVERENISVSHTLTPSPSPRSFGLATLSASDVVLAEDETKLLRQFHENVTRKIS